MCQYCPSVEEPHVACSCHSGRCADPEQNFGKACEHCNPQLK